MSKSEGARIARLTKRAVDAATPETVRFTVWDADLKGFGLRVEPSGTKTFVCRYRVGGGRRGTLRQFKVGRYGKLTPDQARVQAEQILAQVELGRDPQADREAGRAALTVSELCDLYLAEGGKGKKSSTMSIDALRIQNHIKPSLGSLKITEIGRADIERFVDDIASGRLKGASERARGGPGAASRSTGLLGAIFRFAVARKLCAENVVDGVRRPKDRKRDRFLSPAELAAIGDALRAAEQAGALRERVAAIRLLCLTGARKNEIARLKWSEVDLARGRLALEDSKTGAKVIPVGAPARMLIEAQPRGKSRYVFPRPDDPEQPINGIDWFWVTIREAAKVPDVRIHDLRHSFASFGVAGGATLLLLGKILGHSDVSTTQRYAHLADDPVRAAADSISSAIDAALSGKAADIVSLKAVKR